MAKLKKDRKKVHLQAKGRQRLSLKMIMIFGVCSMAICLAITTVIGLTDVRLTKASDKNKIEVINVEDQKLINDMSIEKLQFKPGKTANENSILIQKIKSEYDSAGLSNKAHY